MPNSVCADFSKHDITEKYYDSIYRLALSQTKNADAADDVVQEVFLRYIRTDKPFESEEHIKAWLIRVTINCAKSHFMSSWFKKTAPLTEDLSFELPEQSDVYYAVAELERKYRTVIHLFYFEDYSVKEIARALKMNESTVKSRLHRGRQLLKNMLEGSGEYEF